MQLALLQKRMQFDLVNHRRNARFINQPLQVVNLEITHPNAFSEALLLQFNHAFPCINIVVDSRDRPVHQIKIDMIELKLLKTLFQRLLRALLIVIPQFGSDKQLITRNACTLDGFPYAFFVFVCRSGIDGAIPYLQRFMNGLNDFIVPRLPHAEAKLWHNITVLKLNYGLICHKFLLLEYPARCCGVSRVT